MQLHWKRERTTTTTRKKKLSGINCEIVKTCKIDKNVNCETSLFSLLHYGLARQDDQTIIFHLDNTNNDSEWAPQCVYNVVHPILDFVFATVGWRVFDNNEMIKEIEKNAVCFFKFWFMALGACVTHKSTYNFGRRPVLGGVHANV
jgi:hypothetical protein